MKNMLTVCVLFHCLNNLIVGRILPQQALIVTGNNDPFVCNNNCSIFLDAISI